MESSSTISFPTSKKSSKRFLFDRRYGFVYDEWREPSEVALAYGRGMFCIVPLGKALFKTVSESVNLAASCTIDILERPDKLSPRILQANLNDQLDKVTSSIKKPESDTFGLFHIPLSMETRGSSPPLTSTHELGKVH